MPKTGLLQAIPIHKNLQKSIFSNISSTGSHTSCPKVEAFEVAELPQEQV